MTSTLFSSFALGRLDLRNCLVVGPMCQSSAVDGNATARYCHMRGKRPLNKSADVPQSL
jgi:2,4-dienoyl-CoA reductase-like NADH-dependent reductase (Old Yellow Enzyme family)